MLACRLSLVCACVCLALSKLAVSAQYLNEIFINAVVSSGGEVYGGSSTEDVVGNTYQVFMFNQNPGTVTIGDITLVNQGGWDTAVVKFDPLGNVDWVRALQSPGNEEYFQVTTDPSGNVYVGGFTDTSQAGFGLDWSWDGILAKYDSNGNLKFITNKFSNPYFFQQQDAIHSIMYSNNYLYFLQASASRVAYVFQTDLLGNTQWNYLIPMVSVNGMNAFQFAADPLRNIVYITGQINGGTWSSSVSNGKTVNGFAPQNWDGYLFAISTSGFAQWVQPQQSPNNDYSHTVTVDSGGYVYVGGCMSGSVDGQSYSGNGGQCNPFVQKYDWNGNRQWTRIYSQYVNYLTDSVVVDNTGAFYARPVAGGSSQAIIKSDTNGNVIWIQGLQGTSDTVEGGGNWLPNGWTRGGNNGYIDGSGALTLSGVYSGQFNGWASSPYVPYVSKWQLNITCQSCAQFDAVLGQLQALLNVVVN